MAPLQPLRKLKSLFYQHFITMSCLVLLISSECL